MKEIKNKETMSMNRFVSSASSEAHGLVKLLGFDPDRVAELNISIAAGKMVVVTTTCYLRAEDIEKIKKFVKGNDIVASLNDG